MFLPRGLVRARVLRLVIASLVFAAPHAVLAEPAELFTVAAVEVDAKAETAAKARDLALIDGQRRALDRLLRRLTLRADHARHPRLDDAQVTALVSSLQISNERTSSVRYLATLTVGFKNKSVRRMLRDDGIPFTEATRKPLLVLPLYEVAGALLLWDDPNPWFAAWRNRPVDGDAPVSLRLPEGDLADVVAISAAQARVGNAGRLGVLAAHHGVADIVVADARLEVDLAANRPRLHVSLRSYLGAGGGVVIESFTGESRDEVEALLAQAVAALDVGIQERWKSETLLRFDREVRLSATVPLSGLAEWVAMRKRLGETALVQEVELESLSRSSAQVVLHYLGDASQLATELAQRDLDLAESEDGFWTLRFGGAGAPASTAVPGPAVKQ